jgi:bifunctional non-homologous end joining protein LigD
MSLPQVQPIIPVPGEEPFDDPNWLFEFKYDGYRGLCYIEQASCRFLSLADRVAVELEVDGAILDGEVIAVDESGRPQFYDLVRGSRKPSYVALDLLWLNGADVRSLPLHERRRCPQQ